MALQRLMQSERVLMAGIIPLSHQPHVFETIVAEAIDSIVQEGEVTNNDIITLPSLNVFCGQKMYCKPFPISEHCSSCQEMY